MREMVCKPKPDLEIRLVRQSINSVLKKLRLAIYIKGYYFEYGALWVKIFKFGFKVNNKTIT